MNESALQRTILIVDDEPEILESLGMIFKAAGYRVLAAASGAEAIRTFSETLAPVILCDNSLPDAMGIDLLKEFRQMLPEAQVIMVTGKGTIDLAVAAMKAGIFDFVTKPVDPEYLLELVKRALQMYDALEGKRTLAEQLGMMTDTELIGGHPSFRRILKLVNTVAPTDSTVLIEGESGTGKELIARLIHRKSRRAAAAFMAVDCGAIPEGLVESELFGHERGAFTGAVSAKQGRFERADRGSLFLDEITNLPVSSQSKLLRALQEQAIERVGGVRPVKVNIRLIAATNVSISDMVRDRAFREDLYYRLNIINIKIPPLRERKSDILPLALSFVKKHRERVGSSVTGISRDALRALMDHHWPGNVRELENTIEHALIMAGSPEIMPQDLPDLGGGKQRRYASSLSEAERELIQKALNESGGNKYKAAQHLGIPRSSLYSKLKKYGMA